jgi:hypothetical protein
MIISNSAKWGGVAEETWDDFAGSAQVLVDGFPGDLSPAIVMNRARYSPTTPYAILGWNWDDFVRYCHGLPLGSPQVAMAVLAVVGLGIALRLRA